MASKGLTGTLFAVAVLAAAATASAATYCPASESFFGTIERVNGSLLTVQTPSGHWADVRIEGGARINANGNAIRPGAYIGAYGCVTPGGIFNANELTLTTNRAEYQERLSGVVRRIESGRLIVAQTTGRYASWYVPNAGGFRVGESVSGIGMVSSNGSFYPQSVNGRMLAYDTAVTTAPGTISLSGTVQRVGSNTLLVWEPATRHSATWIVPNAGGRFRAGERVSATGTEDRHGRFYVRQISIF